ncbi:transposase [Limnoraphis robusta]
MFGISVVYDGEDVNRLIDGIVEGINNKLKLLKRCGFGLRNFSNA